ncbi:MAG: LuxR family transcriptional regulator [Solirubrobacterales bacterium]|nr:LuxR family transcriptional regulator [Solirubrobacterales bacterium]
MATTESQDAAGTDERAADPLAAERVTAALDRVRHVLGPGAVPDPAEDGDAAALEESVDIALLELGGLVKSYSGPDALEVTRTAYELAEVARLMRQRSVDRRTTGLTAVQRALADLRAVGSVELMLRRCTQVVCERCGFDRAVLFRLEDDAVFPASAFDRSDPDYQDKIEQQLSRLAPPRLDQLPLESEMTRRRIPTIVHDVMHDPRTFKPMLQGTGITSYVAAPIAPEGRVIGFLHATVRSQGREVDVIDRDILWAFAEGCGYALERTLLHDQVRRQRDDVRELLRSADVLITQIGESALHLERAESEGAERAAAPLQAGGSRVHALLTPREVEVMELLVHGATNRHIAERLVVSEATAKSHVTHILRKLRVSNRAGAVHRYMRLLNLDHH